jgi:hypothetical protein
MSLGVQAASVSDESFLIREFKGGKSHAFEIIFNRHYGALCYFANKVSW